MDKKLTAKILQNVENLRDEIVKAVSDVVKIKSVTPEFGWEPEVSSGGESEVTRYTKTIFDKMGIENELYEKEKGRANLCARYKGAGGGRSLLFNGHVDVVPPGDLDEWDGEDPFSGRVDEKFIYGRGSVDMKGGNIAAIFALKALQQAGIHTKGDIVFQNVVGEECKVNEIGTTACLEKGYTADAAIVCEPTCSENDPFMIHVASVGVLEMKWSVKGKSCHVGLRGEVIRDGGGGMDVGVDAFEKGMIVYNALKELERQWGQTKAHPLYKAGQFCINAATVKGGVSPSVVPPDIEMSYAITYPPQESASGIQKEIELCVHNACQNDPWLREKPPEITWLFDWPPFNTDLKEDICSILQQTARMICPEAGRFNGFEAVCDASFLQEKGIPAVVLGPGYGKYAHSVAERVPISQLIDAAKIYALTMVSWCGIA
ncbi:MAG: ArgE/DapE family deacylase [Firmicutes bacterium]|nr:ArgE/DapE family deacylase [Bacillota bacterium]